MQSAAKDSPIILREGRESDRNLVLQSWIRSHRGYWFGRKVADASYSKGQEWLCKRLLDRCALLVAAFDEDPDFIAGWACTSTGTVHYVWIRPALRRKGIAKRLLAPYLDQPTTYTHPPAWWLEEDGEHIPAAWSYNPYAAFELAAT